MDKELKEMQNQITWQNAQIEKQNETLSKIMDLLIGQSISLSALDEVLVEAEYLSKVKGLNPKTISQNKNLEKFNEIGGRKLLMKLESVVVVRQRKGTRKRTVSPVK